MITFPNCKINLGLNILRQRPDGYHDIESLMLPVNWTDILEIVPASGRETTLTVTGRGVDCPMAKNLVYKAYKVLADEYNLPPVEIHLHKIIPDGAGLGGGSSDAAFTLMMLNEMFGLGLGNETLAAYAGKIGADCPFFIYNRPMLATETGTTLTPCRSPLTSGWLVIVKPPEGVSTKEAYAGVSPSMPEVPLAEAIDAGDFRYIKNDFEEGIFRLKPAVGEVKRRLSDMGARYAAMSGSGSAVFGIFDNPRDEEEYKLIFPRMDVHVEQIG